MLAIRKLSIVIPAYNEEGTVQEILDALAEVQLLDGTQKELILVDDGSTDSTVPSVESWRAQHPTVDLSLLRHPTNLGKGAAIQTGLSFATGDYFLIQDADMEYDPCEIEQILSPVRTGRAEVVYGSRFLHTNPKPVLRYRHSLINRALTAFSNLFTNLGLTDMETCYKLFPTEMLRSFRLRENGFGFEPEVTAKLARVSGVRIYEVAISYRGRSYQEGKKIGLLDGVWAIVCILRYSSPFGRS